MKSNIFSSSSWLPRSPGPLAVSKERTTPGEAANDQNRPDDTDYDDEDEKDKGPHGQAKDGGGVGVVAGAAAAAVDAAGSWIGAAGQLI